MVYNESWSYNPYYDGYYGYGILGCVDEACVYDDPYGWQPRRESSLLITPFFSVFSI